MIETRLEQFQAIHYENPIIDPAGLKLCIDLDGTVTEPYYWLKWANHYFQKNLLPQDITIYQIHTLLGIEEAEYQRFYDLYGEWMHRTCRMREGAGTVIRKLYQNHQVHFVTAREEKMRAVSLAWLKRHQIPLHSLHLLGGPDKVHTAKDLACDLFIEDSYANAIQLSAAGFLVVLINCSYNQGPLPDRVIRVDNWAQIDPIIAVLANVRLTGFLHRFDTHITKGKKHPDRIKSGIQGG